MKYLQILFITAMCSIRITAHAQLANWQWAVENSCASTSGSGQDHTLSKFAATDRNGNIFVSGTFAGDAIVFGHDTLPGNVQEPFIAKYDAAGNALWGRCGIGDFSAFPSAGLCTDADGNVYMAGMAVGNGLQFDSIFLLPRVVTDYYTFLIKYDGSGKLLWAKILSEGTPQGAASAALCSDGNYNIYMTGGYYGDRFQNTLMMGPDTLRCVPYSTSAFVARLDSGGRVLWAKYAIGIDANGASAVSADAFGHVFITGSFTADTLVFAQNTAQPGILFNTGLVHGSSFTNNDVFVAKYDSSGAFIWAKDISGTGEDHATGCSADGMGNVYVTGYYASDTLILGADTLFNTTHGNSHYDVFVAKYDSSGKALWATSNGGTGDDYSVGICADAGGNAYYAGYYNSLWLTFGPDTLFNQSYVANQNVFVAAGNAYGSPIWQKDVGYQNYPVYAQALCIDNNNNIYLTGEIGSSYSMQFDSIVLTNPYPASNLAYLAQLSQLSTGLRNTSGTATSLIAYPNPNPGWFYLDGTRSDDIIEIYNVIGQSVYNSKATGSICPINISNCAKGIYIYTVRGSDGVVGQGKVAVE